MYFYDKSLYNPSTFKWTFEGGTSSSTNYNNASVTYNELGSYPVKLIASNMYGVDSVTEQNYIVVRNSNYDCINGLGGGGCPSDISKVEIFGTSLHNTSHNICNNSNGSTFNAFPETENTTATLCPDSSYEINVVTLKEDAISAWIDYNKDETFDISEHIFITNRSLINGQNKVKFKVPGKVTTGKTWMRVRTREGGLSNGPDNACTQFGTGVTEDYLITLAVPGFLIGNIVASEYIICKNTLTDFSTTVADTTGRTYKWYFGTDATPSFSNYKGPHKVKYSSAGSKTISLTIDGIFILMKTIEVYDMPHLCGSVTIENTTTSNEIYVYPNPFENQVAIKSPSPISLVVISDVEGRVLKTYKYFDNNYNPTLNLEYLKAGIYNMKILANKNVVNAKLIKVN